MYDTWKDRVAIWIIYIQEAHPQDGWQMQSNTKAGVVYNQPKTTEEREKIAHACKAGLDLKIPFLVDGTDNTVDKLYAAVPERLYIINKEGKIHYKGGKGPFGFKPEEAEAALKTLDF